MTPETLALLALPPLAAAAGIDLYLTLLLLGSMPTLGVVDAPLPGALADLDSPGVLVVLGAMFVLEFLAERRPTLGLMWNGLHAIIRPMSGALLALLALEGQPLPLCVAGALVSGALASAAHAARSGRAVMRWLSAEGTPGGLLPSLAEDALVVGLALLALARPELSAGATAGLALVTLPWTPAWSRAFVFALRLAVARAFRTAGHRRWHGPGDLPGWAVSSGDAGGPGSDGALRAAPVGVLGLAGAPKFVSGWMLAGNGPPVLTFRHRTRARRVALEGFRIEQALEHGFFRRVDLRSTAGSASLFLRLDGPPTASVEADFPGTQTRPEENL